MNLHVLQKYPQTFFYNFNNKAKLNRIKHRLIAWYILNRIGKDSNKGLHFFLKYLAKHADIKKSLNTSFLDYKSIVEKKYRINIDTQSNILKKELLNGCKICRNCASRSKSEFCSIKCANSYHKMNGKKISEGLKKYYKTADKKEISNKHSKIKKTIDAIYNNMTADEKRLKCSNKTPRYTSYDNFSSRFPDLTLECSKEYYYNNTEIPIKCKCGNKFIAHKSTGFFPICRKCTPTEKHKTQNEICNYIDSLYNGIVISDDRNSIKPFEIDIRVGNIGIEYNGIISHSFGKTETQSWINNWEKRDSNIHLRKTELCEQKNIHLFHINEYEWKNKNKQKIWKSMIKNALGVNDNIIYARKTYIKEVQSKDANEFIRMNHIQGIKNAKIKIGLYYEDTLVQIMTFGVPAQKKYKGDNNYELVRLCSLMNTNIVGGAKRVYKPNFLISYANRRWAYSKSTVYNKLGFEFIGNTKPNYVVCKTNNNNIQSRQTFQKHKLSKILKNYDEKLSAINNIVNNGYRIFYDSGNMIYTKIY